MTRPTRVVIVGAGHLGKLLFDCLHDDPRWDIVGFIDDGEVGKSCFGKPVFAADRYDPASGSRPSISSGRASSTGAAWSAGMSF